jgi:hypothetical protein
VTWGWVFAVLTAVRGPIAPHIAAGSPIIGLTFPTTAMLVYAAPEWRSLVFAWCLWIAVYAFLALALAWATLATFDRCLGRVPETNRSFKSSRTGSRTNRAPLRDSQVVEEEPELPVRAVS